MFDDPRHGDHRQDGRGRDGNHHGGPGPDGPGGDPIGDPVGGPGGGHHGPRQEAPMMHIAWGFFYGSTRFRDRDPGFRPDRFPQLVGLDGPPDRRRERIVLVDIPFCAKRCRYCWIDTFHGRDLSVLDRYVDSVLRTLDLFRDTASWQEAPMDMITLQGGTPTDLSIPALQRLIPALVDGRDLAADLPVFVETNPARCGRERMEALREVGVNVLSTGVQSLNPDLLAYLGTNHGPEHVEAFFRNAREVGVPLACADLIVGIPGQTLKDIEDTFLQVVEWGAGEIWVFPLQDPERGSLSFAETREHLLFADDLLLKAGYHPKFANWYASDLSKRNGVDVRAIHLHQNQDCFAMGVDCAGSFGGRRYNNIGNLDDYIARVGAGEFPVDYLEPRPDTGEAAQWWLAESLVRLRVSRGDFARAFDGRDLDATLPLLALFRSRDLLREIPDGYECTPLGRVMVGQMLHMFLRRTDHMDLRQPAASRDIDPGRALDVLIGTLDAYGDGREVW